MISQRSLIYPTALQADTSPDQPAVVGDDGIVTHADLDRRIVDAARRLVSLGIHSGDRVVLSAPNSLEWSVIAHAVVRVGATLVPLSTRLAPAETLQQVKTFDPRVVLGDASLYDVLSQESGWANRIVLLGEPQDRVRVWWERIPPARVGIDRSIDPTNICTIISTSGTTGEPKGVCLTLANHLAAAESSRRNLMNTASDRWLVNMPFYHIGGLATLFRAATGGLSTVIHDCFDPERTAGAIEHQGITHLSLVENTLRRLLDAWKDRPFPQVLRAVLAGGGPIDAELLRRARSLGLPVLPTYGLTEASSQVATLSPDAPEAKRLTAGRPLWSCEVEIRNTDGSNSPQGGEGEIAIRGPMVAASYWTSSGKVPAVTPDGWLATHDVGVIDSDGYLIIRGRIDDMIISGGEKIFPAEIESVLMLMPGIQRAAVLGVTDPRWGQVPIAMIEVADESALDYAAMNTILCDRLSRHKIPRQIIPVPSLPMTSTGKINRRQVSELYRRLGPSQSSSI